MHTYMKQWKRLKLRKNNKDILVNKDVPFPTGYCNTEKGTEKNRGVQFANTGIKAYEKSKLLDWST